jgi:ubiquitin-protein ligase
MASNRARRIAKEIADIQNDKLSQIKVEPAGNGDDLTHLRGQFFGPPDTPYEGGTFAVDIKIPSEYPFRPPGMRFETKIWHPNVSSQTVGHPRTCKREGTDWSGCYLLGHTIFTMVASPHHQICPYLAPVSSLHT